MRRGGQSLVAKTPADVSTRLPGADAYLEDAPLHRLAGREHLVRSRYAPAASGGRYAADVRAEAGSVVTSTHEATEEHRFLGRCDARVDRAAEPPDEPDLDATARKLGVEPADDEALGAGKLELNLSRHGKHPRARHRNADLEPAAFVRCAGRRCSDRARADESGKDGCALHGTARRNQKAERPPPASSSTIAPPAKRSVISRFWVL